MNEDKSCFVSSAARELPKQMNEQYTAAHAANLNYSVKVQRFTYSTKIAIQSMEKREFNSGVAL